MKNRSVLLLSLRSDKLKRREAALRKHGFDVKPVASPGEARFEIEMGRCGVFITCGLIPDIVNQDLMELFRKFCSRDAIVVWVAGENTSRPSPYKLQPDISVPSALDPDGIIQALRGGAELPSESEAS
jgi:hypothetical protein